MTRLPALVPAVLVALPACAPADAPVVLENATATGDSILADAFRARRSDVQVEGSGVVSRILADDDEGSRHQRFILVLPGGQTLLVAHNIDVAPRVEGLGEGDTVAFHGEYEWNPQGGVLHWTHRDSDGRHPHGWLRHGGRIYE